MTKFASDRSRAQWFAESFPERHASVLQFRAWIAQCGTDGKKVKDGLEDALAIPKRTVAEEAAADAARVRESLRVLVMAAERLATIGDSRYARKAAAATKVQQIAWNEISEAKTAKLSAAERARVLEAEKLAALPHARVQAAAVAVLKSVGAKRRALWAARVRRKRDAFRKAVDVRAKAEAEARRAARAAKKEAAKAAKAQPEPAAGAPKARRTSALDWRDRDDASSVAESAAPDESPEGIGAAAAEAYTSAALAAVAEQVWRALARVVGWSVVCALLWHERGLMEHMHVCAGARGSCGNAGQGHGAAPARVVGGRAAAVP